MGREEILSSQPSWRWLHPPLLSHSAGWSLTDPVQAFTPLAPLPLSPSGWPQPSVTHTGSSFPVIHSSPALQSQQPAHLIDMVDGRAHVTLLLRLVLGTPVAHRK